MAARQFERDEVVTFHTGEVATVAKVQGRECPFHTVFVWLRFPGHDALVSYKQTDLRRLAG
jgi:hypothetical protein